MTAILFPQYVIVEQSTIDKQETQTMAYDTDGIRTLDGTFTLLPNRIYLHICYYQVNFTFYDTITNYVLQE